MLLGSQIGRKSDVLASPAPRRDALLKPGERGLLRLASSHETAEGVEGGEVVEASPGADGGPAVGFDEVDGPGVSVVLEVSEDPRHSRSTGGWGAVIRYCPHNNLVLAISTRAEL